MKNTTLLRARPARPLVLTSVAVALLAGGCDKPTPGEQAMLTATNAVGQVPHGVRTPEARSETYDSVVSSLAPALSDDETSASAAALAGRARFGIADEASHEYAGSAHGVFSGVSTISNKLGDWRLARAEAEAFASFDPSADVQRINQDIRRIDAEAASNVAKRGDIQRQIDDLLANAAKAQESEGALRLQIAELSRKRSGVSAIEGEAIAHEAYGIQREADALATEAGRLNALVGSIQPQLTEFNLRDSMFAAQKAQLGESLRILGERQANAKESAAQATDKANRIANEIIQSADTLDGLVAQTSELFTQSTGAYASARSGQARGNAPASAQTSLVRQESESSEAVLGAAHIGMLRAYAALMNELAPVESELRGGQALRFADRGAAALAEASELEPEAPADEPADQPTDEPTDEPGADQPAEEPSPGEA